MIDQSVNFKIVSSRLAVTWKPKRGVSITEIGGGRILCQFYHALDMKRVLDGAPWTFGNGSLLIHRLAVGESPFAVPLNKLMFCVQIYGVLLGFFTERVGMMLGNFIGKFLGYDGSNKGVVWKTYMCIRVEMDVSLPLKRKKNLKLGSTGSAVVNFKYEKL